MKRWEVQIRELCGENNNCWWFQNCGSLGCDTVWICIRIATLKRRQTNTSQYPFTNLLGNHKLGNYIISNNRREILNICVMMMTMINTINASSTHHWLGWHETWQGRPCYQQELQICLVCNSRATNSWEYLPQFWKWSDPQWSTPLRMREARTSTKNFQPETDNTKDDIIVHKKVFKM